MEIKESNYKRSNSAAKYVEADLTRKGIYCQVSLKEYQKLKTYLVDHNIRLDQFIKRIIKDLPDGS